MNTNQSQNTINIFKKSEGEKKYLKAMKKVFKSNGSPAASKHIVINL